MLCYRATDATRARRRARARAPTRRAGARADRKALCRLALLCSAHRSRSTRAAQHRPAFDWRCGRPLREPPPRMRQSRTSRTWARAVEPCVACDTGYGAFFHKKVAIHLFHCIDNLVRYNIQSSYVNQWNVNKHVLYVLYMYVCNWCL